MEKNIVFGAGLSGISAKKILERNGKTVILVDDKVGISSSEALKILGEIKLFVKSPGIPYVELVKEAQRRGIEVIDEIELAYRELKKRSPKTKIIAVTGTNGKTTTTAKIADLLNYSGYKAAACGNIGKPFGEIVLERADLEYIVLECSSFQLENIKEFRADIAMVINLAPDHMERYGKIGDYYDVKFTIGKNQDKNNKFILNLKDSESLKRINRVSGQIFAISADGKQAVENILPEIYVKQEEIFYKDEKIIEEKELALKGKHNLENMLFVTAVGKIVGVENEKIKEFLMNAKPIEHRLETFFKRENTLFINDSKGTNIDSMKFAVEAYPGSILICGGKDKKMDLAPLAELIKAHAKEVYLIGENRFLIKENLTKVRYPEERVHDVENLENCISALKKNIDLSKENKILFSPATSSFDQFKNFEERGKVFKEMIMKNFGGKN